MAMIDLTDSDWLLVIEALRDKAQRDLDNANSYRKSPKNALSVLAADKFAARYDKVLALANKIEESY